MPTRSRDAEAPPKRGTRPRPEAQPRRRRSPVWARLCLAFGILLVLASGGTIVGRYAVVGYASHAVHKQNLLGAEAATPKKQHAQLSGPKNILLIGVDNRPDQPVNDPIRADSIIIVHIPETYDSAYMVSIPRDTWTKIPNFNNGSQRVGGGYDKINGAYAAGGTGLTGDARRQKSTELLARTIRENYGITFDGAAIVDFTGFQEVVKVLGGVDMYIDQRVESVHIGFTKDGQTKVPFKQGTNADGSVRLTPIKGVTPMVYEVGQRHMEPWQALDYVRQRETLPGGDYDRQRHQQQFLKAVVSKILSAGTLTNPVKLAEVLKVVGGAMTVDTGSYDIEDWIYSMRNVRTSDVITLKTNNGGFHPSPQNHSAESLDDTTLEMLAAIKNNTIGAFLTSHPQLRINS